LFQESTLCFNQWALSNYPIYFGFSSCREWHIIICRATHQSHLFFNNPYWLTAVLNSDVSHIFPTTDLPFH